MFGKKKPEEKKELSPKEVKINQVAAQVEQLSPEGSLVYKLPEFYWAGFAGFCIVEQNPDKGKKYVMSTDRIVDGKPAGRKSRVWASDKPKDVAGWIVDKQGELFS